MNEKIRFTKKELRKIKKKNFIILDKKIKKIRDNRNINHTAPAPCDRGATYKGLHTGWKPNEKQKKKKEYMIAISYDKKQIQIVSKKKLPYGVKIKGPYSLMTKEEYLEYKRNKVVDKRKKVKINSKKLRGDFKPHIDMLVDIDTIDNKTGEVIETRKQFARNPQNLFEGLAFKTEVKEVKLHYFVRGRYHVIKRMREVRTPLLKYVPDRSLKFEKDEKGNIVSKTYIDSFRMKKSDEDKKDEFTEQLQKNVRKHYSKLQEKEAKRKRNKRKNKNKHKSPIAKRKIKNNKSQYYPREEYPKRRDKVTKLIEAGKRKEVSEEHLDQIEKHREKRFRKYLEREAMRNIKRAMRRKHNKIFKPNRDQVKKEKFEEKEKNFKKYLKKRKWEPIRSYYAYKKSKNNKT